MSVSPGQSPSLRLQTKEDVENHMADLMAHASENSLGIVTAESPRLELDGWTVEQSRSLLYQHSTGAVVWNTTPRFAAWLPGSPLRSLVENRTVIELGSGTGALALLLSGLARRHIATDQKPLLKLARRNCAGLRSVEVREFDWEVHAFEGVPDEGVVVACDTIYNEYLVKPLATAVLEVWRACPNVAAAIICVQLRESSILEHALTVFLEAFDRIEAFSIAPGYMAYLVRKAS